MQKFSFAAGALALSLMAGSAQAVAVFSFSETVAGVQGTLTGELDLTGAFKQFDDVLIADSLYPSLGVLQLVGNVDVYEVSGPDSFGSGSGSFSSSAGGSPFFLTTGTIGGFPAVFLGVPDGYDIGDLLNGFMDFSGESFATLGVDVGDHVYTLPSGDTLTLRFAPAAIPLPTTLPLLLGALGLTFATARRRRGARAA